MLRNEDITTSGHRLAKVLEIFPSNSSSIKLFDQFLTVTLEKSISNIKIDTPKGIIRLTNLKLYNPSYTKDGKIYALYPQKCRTERLSYTSNVIVDLILQDKNGDTVKNSKGENIERKNIILGNIPIMKGSIKCNLRGLDSKQLRLVGEDPVDPDGYFIVGGAEKTILYQEQLSTNRIFLMMNDPKQGVSVRLTTSDALGTHVNEIVLDKEFHQVIKLKLASFKNHSDDKLSSSDTPNSALMIAKTSEKKFGTLNVLKVFQLLGLDDLDEIKFKILRFIDESNHIKCMNKFMRTIADFKISTNSRAETVAALGKKIMINYSPNNQLVDQYIDQLLYKDLFHHLNDTVTDLEELKVAKIDFLSILVAQMLEYNSKIRQLSDRNSWSNKKTQSASGLMQQLFNGSLRKIINSVKYPKGKNSKNEITFDAIFEALTRQTIITDSFFSSFNTPNWGVKGGQTRANVAQTLSRDSLVSTYSHLSTIDVNVSRSGNTGGEVKMIQMTSFGFICSIATPEGENCGLLKNFSITTELSQMFDDSKIIRDYMNFDSISKVGNITQFTALMINAKFIGWCDGEEMRQYFISLRREGKLPKDTSVVFENNWLNIDLSPYRPVRPLLIVSEDQDIQELVYKIKSMEDSSPLEWITSGCMEYLSPWEQEQKQIKIATKEEDIYSRNDNINRAYSDFSKSEELLEIAKQNGSVTDENNTILTLNDAQILYESAKYMLDNLSMPYTHCEIDPKTQYSIQSNLIHYPDHNQAPRNTYQASMAKQSLGIYHSNYMNRYDGTTKQLPISQSPIVTTETYSTIGLNQRNCGLNINTLFAAMPYTEEDAFIFSKEYIESGGHRILKHLVYKTTLRSPIERLAIPQLGTNENISRYTYIHKVGPSTGLPMIGAYIGSGDCIISRVTEQIGESNKSTAISNSSIFMKIGEEGIVEKILVTQSPDKIETTVMVKLRVIRLPIVGDKFAPRNAQKATIALIISDINLPTTTRGISPSCIANPSCLPSRMTMSYPMEMVFSKYAAFVGTSINGSAFYENNDISKYAKINKLFRERGRNDYGYEKMYSGVSGIKYEGLMNMSLVYFQALRHHSKDKIQSRGTGQVINTTRQPTKGRSNQGGLRFGEMERDAIISHGATSILLERLMYVSDAYKMVICQTCGSIVTVDSIEKGCSMCEFSGVNNFVNITAPYASKFLTQLLGTLGLFESLQTITQKKYSENVLSGRDMYSLAKNDTKDDVEVDDDIDIEEVEDIQYDDTYDDAY